MANNFVKWWKTKFLNGYKQFSADGNYGKISDTEELLGNGYHESDSDDRLRTATPPTDPNNTADQRPTSNTPTQQHLNLEEFSCDVSVEGGVDRKGQERQEFSFTLYDFDGYGKITKDDIAGLVTTIYEALGSSVKVPHYGSKTIRVKLTVSPDQRKHVSATVINEKEKSDEKSEHSSRLKRDLNVTIRQGNKHCRKTHKRKEARTHHCCDSAEVEQEECVNVSDDSSDVFSNISGDVTSEDDGESSDHYVCSKIRQKKYQKKLNKYTVKENLGNQEGCSKNGKGQKRSSSLQRQELLEIIQANMDKDNLGLQSTRKQTNNHTNFETKNSQRNELKPHQRRQKSTNMPTLQYLANIMDPTHFYVDLASFQNATQLPSTNCQYNKLIDAVMYVSSKKVPVKKNTGCRKHNRIKSHEHSNTPLRCNILTEPVQNNEKTPKKSKSTEVDQTKQFRKNVKKIPQIVLGNTSSPHYLRHRNRQEDQARAMAQVVRWLEQEFSSNFYTSDQNHKTEFRSNSYEKQSNQTNASPSPTSSVERHEHHHVHEHIHHHYHHYQEAPIVV